MCFLVGLVHSALMISFSLDVALPHYGLLSPILVVIVSFFASIVSTWCLMNSLPFALSFTLLRLLLLFIIAQQLDAAMQVF